MFDLNPAVDHLMLDRELPDPFDRDAPVRRPVRGQTYGDGATPDSAPSALERTRHALGTRLIALGSALTVDESAARRTA